MPFIHSAEDLANHPLAHHIPWSVWRRAEFFFNAKKSELARADGTLEVCSVPLQPDEDPLKALLCLAYGHQELPAITLLHAARQMGCNDNTIASAAALSGNLDLLQALTDGKTYTEIRLLILANTFSEVKRGIYEQAASQNRLNILIWLDRVMSETDKQMVQSSNSLYSDAAVFGNLDILIYLESQMDVSAKRAARSSKNFQAYIGAISHKHMDVVEHLESQMDPAEKQEARTAENFGAYRAALRSTNMELIQRLEAEMSGADIDLARLSDDYGAYRNAAAYNNREVLIHLESQMDFNERRAVRKRIYHDAARICQFEMMAYLESEMSEKEIEEVRSAGYPKAYHDAAARGHLGDLLYLESRMTETQRKAACSADNYDAYCVAAKYGHLEVITHFETLMTDDAERKTARAATGKGDVYGFIKTPYAAYRSALKNRRLPVLKYLDEHMENNARMDVLSAKNYEAYRQLYDYNRLDIIQHLDSFIDVNQRKLARSSNGYYVYITAAGRSLKILKYLEMQMDDEERKLARSERSYYAYRFAAQNGRIDIMEHLERQMDAEELKAARAAENFGAYSDISCDEERYQKITRTMRYLETQMSDEELRAARSADSYRVYRNAASYGLLDILKHLERQMSGEERAEARSALGSGSFYHDSVCAYLGAAKNGHMDILLHLEGQMSDDEKASTFRTMGPSAFVFAVTKKHRAMQEHFLCIPEIFAWAEMHENEYGNVVHPFVQNQLATLHRAHDDFEISNPNGVFNLVGRDCVQGFFIARNLIRQNTAASLDELRFLLTIPGVALMADHNANELLRLALTLENRGASEVLLTLTRVREHAQRHNYYADEMHGSLNLQEIAADRESSMRALSPAERKLISRVSYHYQPELVRLGSDNILEMLREQLRERYRANPARITLDGQARVVPLDWQEFQDMNLSGEALDEARKAYYQHPDHSALRWLLRPNPWMANNAAFVEGDARTGHAYSTFGNFQDLVCLLWLAASDEDSPGIDGHTVQTRIDHFVREIALINRAHNWDKSRPVTLPDGAVSRQEEYDDLEGDKPSCYSGVNRRLFQSVIGHDLMQPFGVNILEIELRSFARNHFREKIDASNIKLLKQVRDAFLELNPLTEEQKRILTVLDISAVDQESFCMAMHQKYHDNWSRDYMGYLKGKFALDQIHTHHVTKLWTLVDFNNLLNTVEMAGYYYLHRDRNKHAFAASGSDLEDEFASLRTMTGDALKLALLQNFEKKLRDTAGQEDFVSKVQEIASSPAFAKLKQGQGITTRFFQLKTDSKAVFEDIIKDIGKQRGMSDDDIRNLIENHLDRPTGSLLF